MAGQREPAEDQEGHGLRSVAATIQQYGAGGRLLPAGQTEGRIFMVRAQDIISWRR